MLHVLTHTNRETGSLLAYVRSTGRMDFCRFSSGTVVALEHQIDIPNAGNQCDDKKASGCQYD